MVHIVTGFIDPFTRDFFLYIRHFHQGNQFGTAGVFPVLDTTLKTDHTAIDAIDGVFHSHLTGHVALLNIGLGSKMCAAALQKVQFDTAYLRAGLFFQHLR